jgi:predicted HAD superfamily phosphohydrolase
MSPLISTSYPEYLDKTLTMANLSLIGVKCSEFALDTERARFSNYSSLLSAAGFA